MRKIHLLLLLSIFALKISAQHEIFIGGSIEKPLGELAWTYKPSKGINLGYNFLKLNRPDYYIIGGVCIGYSNLSVLQDTFYFLIEPKSYGTAVFSKYSIFAVDAEFKLVYDIKQFGFYGAFDIGYHYTNYSYTTNVPITGESKTSSFEGKAAICPKIGIQYMFNNFIGLYTDIKYNFLFSAGSGNSNDVDFNPNMGSYNTYLSFGTGLIIKINNK